MWLHFKLETDKGLGREIVQRASELRYPAEAIMQAAIKEGLRTLRTSQAEEAQRQSEIIRCDITETIVEKPPEKEMPIHVLREQPRRSEPQRVRFYRGGKTQSEKAKSFLHDLLSEGPISSLEVSTRAKGASISERTLSRAKKRLGIESKKGGFRDGWMWEFPEQRPKAASINRTGIAPERGAGHKKGSR